MPQDPSAFVLGLVSVVPQISLAVVINFLFFKIGLREFCNRIHSQILTSVLSKGRCGYQGMDFNYICETFFLSLCFLT
jgi:hypothetical protein